MTELKREYVVPLRRKSRFAPKWRRSKKAVVVLKDFIKKHMKSENVVICNELNEQLWANGAKNPPGKVSVIALKTTINGTEKTIVNLASVGVDNYVKTFGAQQSAAPSVEEKAAEELKEKDVKDAEVKEVETKETSTKEEKSNTTTSSKKKDTKKEVKKDE
jgi:large subunit ribosomal protein L31e